MVLESLRSSSGDCPEIVEFDPWQWAGQEQLANAFFEEIGKVLGRKTGAKTKQVAKKWKLYGAGLHLTAYVATGFRNALFVLLLVIAVFGIGGATVHSLFSSWLVSAIGYGALGLAILTKWGGESMRFNFGNLPRDRVRRSSSFRKQSEEGRKASPIMISGVMRMRTD
jgi:hypothetical protein